MTITLPESLYRRIAAQARINQVTPVDFLTDFLDTHLAPQHPHIERVHSSGGWRVVVKGTRTGVDAVVGSIDAPATRRKKSQRIFCRSSIWPKSMMPSATMKTIGRKWMRMQPVTRLKFGERVS